MLKTVLVVAALVIYIMMTALLGALLVCTLVGFLSDVVDHFLHNSELNKVEIIISVLSSFFLLALIIVLVLSPFVLY